MNNDDWNSHLVEFKVFQSKVDGYMERDAETNKEILKQIKTLQNQVSLARHFLLFVKLTGYTIIFMLAFKFGDIKTIWSNFFHGS